jgi:hypothetical protein
MTMCFMVNRPVRSTDACLLCSLMDEAETGTHEKGKNYQI